MILVCLYLLIGIGLSFRRIHAISADAAMDGDRVRAAAVSVVTWPLWVGRS